MTTATELRHHLDHLRAQLADAPPDQRPVILAAIDRDLDHLWAINHPPL